MNVPMLWARRAGLAFALTLASQAASADQALIDYRHAVMESIGGHLEALVAIVKGEVPYTQDASVHASAFEPLAKIAQHVFPQDSSKGKTHALPAIWEKPEAFSRAMADFQKAAADMTKVASASPQEMVPSVSALAKACKNCHDDFRKKD